MRILVTGGGGFLGTSICRLLLQTGHQPVAFQRGQAEHIHAEGMQVFQGDICDISDVKQAAEGCEAVIHTAGKAGIWGKSGDFFRINVDGTRNVLASCRELGIAYLVHTSSPSIVHSGGDVSGADESLPIADHFPAPYPASKAEAEKRVIAANDEKLKTVALRPHLIWGPGDPHILPRLVEKSKGGSLALPGPDKLVDTIFVENAAQAHVLALRELQQAGRCAGKPYFVTNNEPLPQGEIIRKLLAAVGVEVNIRAVPVGLARFAGAVCESAWRTLRLDSEPPVTRFSVEQLATAHWYDTSAAKEDFEYEPEISIAEGLERLGQAGL